MKTNIYFLGLLIMAFCLSACNSKTDPEKEDPNKETTDPGSDTPSKDVIAVTPANIAAPAEGGEYTLEITTELKWQVSSNASWVTYNPGVGKGNGKVVVTIEKSKLYEPTATTVTISGYGSDNTDNKVVVNVSRDCLPEDVISGVFSVAEDKQVYFSKGNLQYQASTKSWRFAENQYDIIGADNKNISDTYDGWIDLFGWGAGTNPTLFSKDNADYAAFADWGANMIIDAGDAFRTLTLSEWEYLFSERPNAETLRSPATVNNVKGYIFLSDEWSLPMSTGFTANANDWTTNDYSVTSWATMEQNGAVFLSDAGFRIGNNVYGIGIGDGSYWSSTLGSPTVAWKFQFYSTAGSVKASVCGSDRCDGFSVRLVQYLD